MDALSLAGKKGAKKLLATLAAYPKRKFTINGLAKEAKVPFSSTWRMVKNWEAAGIIETGRIGNSVTVTLRQTDYAQKIVEIAELSKSPQKFALPALEKMLKKNSAVKAAFLFGSVARGEETPGSDIDIAIWCGKEFDAKALAMGAYDKLGVKAVPIVFQNERELNAFLKGKEQVKLK